MYVAIGPRQGTRGRSLGLDMDFLERHVMYLWSVRLIPIPWSRLWSKRTLQHSGTDVGDDENWSRLGLIWSMKLTFCRLVQTARSVGL